MTLSHSANISLFFLPLVSIIFIYWGLSLFQNHSRLPGVWPMHVTTTNSKAYCI
ncbi:hypothetical protein TRIATDRAFT_257891 [Trichoderma atroviride IMI 206040]|uniref:Uncharacterized protein n=1 Tax=Hypocrea atroviridis (strain ATCC 20476 / IMI 206040) TaxID=452589 RepID=G9NXX7_HYPAI|nr:uncharacterized protein TRIATDRAFT_257891 [Trichoderma atroviride IMI 206040]EHK44306.1 hypothetical protein TRIATDRAFT_257891 [Trichoderma atroviride IMI 206040]